MRTAELVLSPLISGTANAATATANVVMTFPGTLWQFAPPAGQEWSRHNSGRIPDIPRRAGDNPEAIS
jgi:hypothetical protein